MIDATTMYWVARADVINGTLWFCTILWTFICIALWMVWGGSEGRLTARPAVWATVVHVLLFCGACAMPTSKDIAAIVVIPQILNRDISQDIPAPLLDLVNEWTKNKQMKGK